MKTIDNVTNFPHVAGEFVQSGFNWGVEHLVETVTGGVIAVAAGVSIVFGGSIVSGIGAIITYLFSAFA